MVFVMYTVNREAAFEAYERRIEEDVATTGVDHTLDGSVACPNDRDGSRVKLSVLVVGQRVGVDEGLHLG